MTISLSGAENSSPETSKGKQAFYAYWLRKNRGDSLFSRRENGELYRLFRATGWEQIIGSCPSFFRVGVFREWVGVRGDQND
ncbi:MAG: hypothetical protein A2Z43_03650 [Syntrophobacterales bacterium RBG_19FT_COMBO_59_10]|nr:MAG: hypothetical protein A2Z43_03650 [Syntrophobacterales bacterium RBG_19FT_COMBO_59_10]